MLELIFALIVGVAIGALTGFWAHSALINESISNKFIQITYKNQE
jgi:hypothetical protein